jgi:hypothetical protein
MAMETIKKFFTREPKDWEITALIYKVSEPLQGKTKPTRGEQKIIDKIGKLRIQGKLNEQQINILNGMQLFRLDDSDEF